MAYESELLLAGLFGFIVIVSIIYLLFLINGLSSSRRKVEDLWAEIDFLLKKKTDEVPFLLGVVKDYRFHEEAITEALIISREKLLSARTPRDKAYADKLFQDSLNAFFEKVNDDYPEIKAKENYIALERRLASFQGDLRERIGPYNDAVNFFNARIHSLPDSLAAGLLKYRDIELYRVE